MVMSVWPLLEVTALDNQLSRFRLADAECTLASVVLYLVLQADDAWSYVRRSLFSL